MTQPQDEADNPSAEATLEERITELSELQFTTREIQAALDLNPDEWAASMRDSAHPYSRAVTRGRLLADAKVRKSIYRMAQQGSSPAQRQWDEIVAQRRRKEPTHD